MFWVVLIVVVAALLGAGLWVDRKRRNRGPGGALHRDTPESKYFNPYGGPGGDSGGAGGSGGGF